MGNENNKHSQCVSLNSQPWFKVWLCYFYREFTNQPLVLVACGDLVPPVFIVCKAGTKNLVVRLRDVNVFLPSFFFKCFCRLSYCKWQSCKSGRAFRVGFGPKLTKILGLIRAWEVLLVLGVQKYNQNNLETLISFLDLT